MSKIVVLHHSADFDGLFCREIARKFLPDAILIGWDYGDPTPAKELLDGTEQLYMMDISIPDLMDHPNLIWIDHHKTAIEKYDGPNDPEANLKTSPIIRGYRIDGVAACRLAWQWFLQQETIKNSLGGLTGLPDKKMFVDHWVSEPVAVTLAGEYDIWDKRDPDAELFQHGLRGRDVFWQRLLTREQDSTDYVKELLNEGRAIQYARQHEYAEVIKEQGFTTMFGGLTFLCCCSHELDIRSQLFEAGIKPEHDGLLGFTFTGKDWRVSLYGVPGKPDIDLSKIAAHHGGGGHKQACGFRTKSLPFLNDRISSEAHDQPGWKPLP